MKITFLGTGTSTGVPYIGCKCEVCTSTNPKDQRLRASVLVEVNGKNILIDCGPDFRQQMLLHPVEKLEAVLITHEHYDHVGGMDDLRPFKNVPVYAHERVCDIIKSNMPYCFNGKDYPGIPKIELHTIHRPYKSFYIDDVKVTPIHYYHAKLSVLGYRIGDFAYLTDISAMPDDQMYKLSGVDTLVVDALRQTPHFSHFSLEQAIEFSHRVGAKQTYFTHCCHHIGLYDKVEETLPKGMSLAYDNLIIEI